MSKELEINTEIGFCTKDMAKENPIKDFEILIEEHKDKWSKQMYDYFKECLHIIENKLKRLETLEEEKQSFDRQLEKKLKALNEILSLHDKWLGNEMSDFEFFTLLSEIKDKYGLSKEVVLWVK